MKKAFIASLLAASVCLTALSNGIAVCAAAPETNDAHYYATDYDAFMANNKPVLNDENWRRWIHVEKAEIGLKSSWRSAVHTNSK